MKYTYPKTWTDRAGASWPVRVKKFDKQPKLVTFGLSGHTVYFGRTDYGNGCYGTSRLEGYDDPDSFLAPSRWWTDDYATTPDLRQLEGVPFVDVRAAIETPAGRSWVFKGPMPDVDLPEGEIDRCPEPSPMLALAVSENAFGTLLSLAHAHRHSSNAKAPGPLDSVPIAEYLAEWKAHGATVGHIRNGQFVPE